MKKSGEFILSLLALPFLLPWYLSERIFEYFIQPLVFRRFRLGLSRRKRLILRITLIAFGVSVVSYLFHQIFVLHALFPTLSEALSHAEVYFILIVNDLIRALQVILWPVNTLLIFIQGGDVDLLHLALALYFSFLPLLLSFNLVFRLFNTFHSLSKAVDLRNRAVRDVDIVKYAQRAKADEIFLGIDLGRGGAPFYAKRSWLKGHVQIIGASGSGKTESIIQPIWFQEVRRNVATFVLDGKASRRNLDRFYTIATSLAQGHEVRYFNPADPERSATYNPLLHGTAVEIRQKIISSLPWTEASAESKERITHYLDLIVRAIKERGRFVSLEEIFQYLTSKTHVHHQVRGLRDRRVYEGMFEVMENYTKFQTETEFLASTLQEICQSEFAWLLDTDEPEIDIAGIYRRREDCYFTLPIHAVAPAMRFLGQLILQDMMTSFASESLRSGEEDEGNEGLLVIDEFAKFASPSFIELLRICRNVQVSVCYTNQSLAELNNPALNLHQSFVDELADHTNALFCFHLGSPESIRAVMDRIGHSPDRASSGGKSAALIDADALKHLEVGRCVAFVRQPRVAAILKTGYFKFDKLLRYEKRETDLELEEA